MPDLHEGEVEIVVDGETLTLRPTLGAASRISNLFGGYRNAMDRVVAMDLAAVTRIIVAGADVKDEAAKGFDEKVYRTGLLVLTVPVGIFVGILTNGGRAPKTDDGKGEAAPNPGNVRGGQPLN